MEKYRILEKLSSGSMGTVFKILRLTDMMSLVLKRIPLLDLEVSQREQAKLEVELMKKMRHPYIVSYSDAFLFHDEDLCIIMEHFGGGDLATIISQAKEQGKHFSEQRVLAWLVQMLLALHYLHSHRILHRDLKTQNVFLNAETNEVAVGDFGVAKILESSASTTSATSGTPLYMAPEVLQGNVFSFQSDVWSVGCILYELLCFKHPFQAGDIGGLMVKVIRGEVHPIPGRYSSDLQQLVSMMLERNPTKRPLVDDLLTMPILRKAMQQYFSSPTSMSSPLGGKAASPTVPGATKARGRRFPNPHSEDPGETMLVGQLEMVGVEVPAGSPTLPIQSKWDPQQQQRDPQPPTSGPVTPFQRQSPAAGPTTSFEQHYHEHHDHSNGGAGGAYSHHQGTGGSGTGDSFGYGGGTGGRRSGTGGSGRGSGTGGSSNGRGSGGRRGGGSNYYSGQADPQEYVRFNPQQQQYHPPTSNQVVRLPSIHDNPRNQGYRGTSRDFSHHMHNPPPLHVLQHQQQQQQHHHQPLPDYSGQDYYVEDTRLNVLYPHPSGGGGAGSRVGSNRPTPGNSPPPGGPAGRNQRSLSPSLVPPPNIPRVEQLYEQCRERDHQFVETKQAHQAGIYGAQKRSVKDVVGQVMGSPEPFGTGGTTATGTGGNNQFTSLESRRRKLTHECQTKIGHRALQRFANYIRTHPKPKSRKRAELKEIGDVTALLNLASKVEEIVELDEALGEGKSQ